MTFLTLLTFDFSRMTRVVYRNIFNSLDDLLLQRHLNAATGVVNGSCSKTESQYGLARKQPTWSSFRHLSFLPIQMSAHLVYKNKVPQHIPLREH